jgi:hypothetical protein
MAASKIRLIGGCRNEGGADRVVRNGIRDGLGVSVAFRSIVMLFPSIIFDQYS